MRDTLEELYSTLRRSKLRTTLTGISVSTGIFLLIVLLGAGNGIIHAFSNMAGSMVLDVMSVYGGATSKPYHGLNAGRTIQLDDRDISIALHNMSGHATAASGTSSKDNITLRMGSSTLTRTLTAVDPSYIKMDRNASDLIAGRFIDPLDSAERRRVMVLSKQDAEALAGSWESAVGRYINAGGVMYMIAGIYPNRSMSDNKSVYIPLSTYKALYGGEHQYDNISLKTRGVVSSKDVDLFAARFRGISSGIHQFAPDDENAIFMWNTTTGAEETNKALTIIRTALWIIGLLTLISGIVGISNIMLITVKERTHEFGIRKALGARPAQILRTVVTESIIITTIFGYIGLVLGVVATECLNYFGGQSTVNLGEAGNITVFSDPTVDFATAIEALIVMILAGVTAGLIPAFKAVRIKPIEALRAE